MRNRSQRRLEAKSKWKEEGKKESFTEFWGKQGKTWMPKISKLRNRKQRRKVR